MNKRNILDFPVLISGSQNVVCENNLTNLYLDSFSGANYIYTNNFIVDDEGRPPTYDDGSSNIFCYNFWSDWTGPDENNDGYVDNPYLIDGYANNQDSYPSSVPFDHNYILHLMTKPIVIRPNGREVFTASTEPETTHIRTTQDYTYVDVSGGDDNPINIRWVPTIDSHNHSVSYSVFYSSDAGISWKLIEENLVEWELEWELEWEISNLKTGNEYLIKVVATCTEGLTVSDTSDKPFTIFNLSSTTIPNPTPAFSMFIIFVLFIIVVFIRRLRSRRIFL